MKWGKVKKAVIPAAGMGTRFLPVTKSIPKEMLPILDKPTIQFIVEEVIKTGIDQILIIVSQRKNAIIDHFDNIFELEEKLKTSEKWKELEMVQKLRNLTNIYFVRQTEPLGLGHAIMLAEKFVGNEPFAVLSGDDIVLQENEDNPTALKQCIDLFDKVQTSIVGVQEVEHSKVSQYGIVEPDGQIDLSNNAIKLKGMVEKPKAENSPSNYAILGRYVLTPTIFEELRNSKMSERKEIEITDSIFNLIKKEGVFAKIFSGKRYDIGSKLGFLQATIDVSLKDAKLSQDLLEYMSKIVKSGKY